MNKDARVENAVTLNLEETDRVIAALKSVSGNRTYTVEALALLTKLERAAQATRQAFWNAQLEAEQSELRTEAGLCRYCKSAQKRTGKLSAMCRKHAERRRLNYVTSPASESYWAS